ncbi:MAG: trypsin-like peptidase domain-containing protein [Polyangiales bacterium]
MRTHSTPDEWKTPIDAWWAGLLALLLTAGLGAAPANAQPGHATQSLVQGSFSLAEPYDAPILPELSAAVTESQGALMLTSALTLTETTASINDTPPLSELWQLCDGEAFPTQPTAAFCAGTLIAADLVLTAEHCVPNTRTCQALSVVFDYRYTSEGALATLERDDVYACSRVVVSSSTGDYAVVQLDRAVVGRTPATPRFTDPATCTGVRNNAHVWAAGFPSGVPLKLDVGEPGEGDAALGVVVTEEDVSGRRFFRAGFDLFAGMDGGGVFAVRLDEEADGGVPGVTVELVGSLSLGRADYQRTSEGCYSAVTVDDAGSELAAHVIQPLISLCNKTRDYPELCPATVSRCFSGNAVEGADAGMRAFPPQSGCGCRVRGDSPAERSASLASVGLVLVVAVRRSRRRAR